VAEKGGDLPGFADLELIRTEASIAVTRFCALLGIPRASWYRWKSAVRSYPGCWPSPVVDALEPLAASYAATFAAWGHRKLWALLQADGYNVSMSSVARALGRRGLLLPQRYQAERRQLARARRAVFLEPPTRRCRVWQMDFSEFETTGGGIWRLSRGRREQSVKVRGALSSNDGDVVLGWALSAPAASVKSAVLWPSNGRMKSSLISTLDGAWACRISIRPAPTALLPSQA